MRFFFDESGDFAFPERDVHCYSQAAVVCPDSYLDELGRFVSHRMERWSLDELHAHSLTPGQRLRLCRFIAQSPLELIAQATDSALVTTPGIIQWRTAQAATLRRNLRWYRDQGGEAAEIEEWMTARAKRADLATRISNSEFVQATFLIDLIHAALQRSLLVYHQDAWAADFEHFVFILDGKLPGKLGAGEKFLRSMVVPFLGSNPRFQLIVSERWKAADPPHPFIARYERSGGWSGAKRQHVDEDVIDLTSIFERGLRFERSDGHPGLQIADLVAYVVRWAMREPEDWQAQLAFELLRPKLRGHDGKSLALIRLDTGGDPRAATRYQHLAHAS
jgi:Protein of unknown function (DUF3800)